MFTKRVPLLRVRLVRGTNIIGVSGEAITVGKSTLHEQKVDRMTMLENGSIYVERGQEGALLGPGGWVSAEPMNSVELRAAVGGAPPAVDAPAPAPSGKKPTLGMAS